MRNDKKTDRTTEPQTEHRGDMTVDEAGHMGGQKVKELIEKGKHVDHE